MQVIWWEGAVVLDNGGEAAGVIEEPSEEWR